MSDESDCYQTYLLRLWRAQCQGSWQWHASLENPSTGERHAFATLDELCSFLQSGHLVYQGALEAIITSRESEVPPVADLGDDEKG